MKRIVGFLIATFAAIVLIYNILTGKLKLFIELFISANDKFVYTNDYVINDLQLKNADFYYNLLTENQKKIYSSIAKGVNELDKEVIVSKYEIDSIDDASNDVKEALNAFLSDHPEVFYLSSKYTVSLTTSVLGKCLKVELSYIIDDEKKLNTMIAELNTEINEILSQVQNMDVYNKELYVHDYLAKNVKYYSSYKDANELADRYHTAYGALINKEAVCDGITKAYQLILGKLGIENYIVTGYIDKVPHAWNLVNINGNWLHVDITSNKYVKDSNGNTIEPVHTYFNVNTEFIQDTHVIDKLESLPASTSDQYTYYIKNNCYIASHQNFETRVTEIVRQQNNKKILEFATDFEINVPERLLRQLYNINFNNLKNSGSNITINYYNEQNVYIVQKK